MVNDVSIAWGIISVFVLIGVMLPFINEAFDRNVSTSSVSEFEDDLNTDASNLRDEDEQLNWWNAFASVASTSTSFFGIVKSVIGMFFWTFGNLPFWLDAIFLTFRAALLVIFYRMIRSGSG